MAFGLPFMAFGLAWVAFGLAWEAFGLAWEAFGHAPTPKNGKNHEIRGILALRARLHALRARNPKSDNAGARGRQLKKVFIRTLEINQF